MLAVAIRVCCASSLTTICRRRTRLLVCKAVRMKGNKRASVNHGLIMDDLTDDDSDEVLLLENVSFNEKNETNFTCTSAIGKSMLVNSLETVAEDSTLQRKSEYETENRILTCDTDDCSSLLRFNEGIIILLLDLKKHITCTLQKCEKKLTVIEASLQRFATGDTKVLICNAGIPYFKDRSFFFAPNNEDETLKDNRKELQVRNLPKVTPWTKKERNTLSKAIQEDATYLTLVEHIRDQDSMPKSNRRINKKSKKRSLQPRDFIELVDSLRGRDFDWFKISSEHFENVHSPLDCKVMWNVFLHPRINKNSWTKLEDIKLEEIAKGHQFQDWDGVAKELNTNRTAYQCFIRYNTTRKFPKATNCVWEKEEDDRLLKLVKIFKIGNFIPWGEIGSWMKNRTKQQVYFRWTYSLTPCLTKGRFSKSEDNILRDAVSKYGTNFRKISAALMPHRSTVQLHERYQTLTMNQTENWNVWTLKEDSTLLKLFESFGTNWARIAKEFSCKTRIQLRHRHAAIQRYVKRGISIFELHNPHLNSRRIEKNQGKKNEESNQSKLNYNKSASDRDYNVDQELIEYFRKEQTTARSVREQKCYTTNDLNNKTKQLYNILQLLNANLSIPDDINNFKLHDKHRQLLYSLKEYIAAKNAGNMQHKAVVDKCSSLMFGISNTTKEGSRPTLLASSGSRVKLKRSYKTQGIDYHLNTNNTFLVERPKDFQNLDFVTFHIGGNEQELQFEKFSRSLVLHSPKGKLFAQNNEDSFAVSFGTSLDHNNGGINNLNYFKKIRSKNIVDYSPVESSSIHDRVNCAMLPIVNYGKSHKSSTKNITSSDMRNIKKTSDKHINSSAIETTYATLLSLKNLMYFKQLNEIYNNPRQTPAMSKRFQESVRLLEMRLELLFTYPIGLSKTVLPQFYAMDTFSYDDVTPKRKTPKMLKKQKTKLRSHNTSDEDVNQ